MWKQTIKGIYFLSLKNILIKFYVFSFFFFHFFLFKYKVLLYIKQVTVLVSKSLFSYLDYKGYIWPPWYNCRVQLRAKNRNSVVLTIYAHCQQRVHPIWEYLF